MRSNSTGDADHIGGGLVKGWREGGPLTETPPMYTGFWFRVDLIGFPPIFEFLSCISTNSRVLLAESFEEVGPDDGGVSFLGGRPLLGRDAALESEGTSAIFRSFQFLISKRGSFLTLYPTLILTWLLERRSSMGKGPQKDGWSPVVLCCFVYTWVTDRGGSGTSICGLVLV